MKQFKFQNKASVIRGIKEEKPRKRKNWDRLIYLAIFILLLLSLFVYILRKNLYAYSLGEVITERFEVTRPDDIQVVNYFVQENDTVKAGDTLFAYRNDKDGLFVGAGGTGRTFTFNNMVIDKPNEWVIKERANTKKTISLKAIEAREYESSYKTIMSEIEKLKMEVHLDVTSPAVLSEKRAQAGQIKVYEEKVRSEISFLYQYLKQLDEFETEYRNYQKSVSSGPGGVNGSEYDDKLYYITPVSGIITKISRPAFEISYRQEIILLISNLDKVFIRAYIEQNDLPYFAQGDLVDIRFMDGAQSKGRITEFYVNTEEVPEEFRKIRGKNQRNVVATVIPLNNEEQDTWRNYYKFTAQITRLKFF